MATALTRIFTLLRIYYFPTANIPIIYLLQIEQLFKLEYAKVFDDSA